jgi:hypothetical protein
MRLARRVPWYAGLLIGALLVGVVVGLVIHNDTMFLGALGLMLLIAPTLLFYWMGVDRGDDGRTGG